MIGKPETDFTQNLFLLQRIKMQENSGLLIFGVQCLLEKTSRMEMFLRDGGAIFLFGSFFLRTLPYIDLLTNWIIEKILEFEFGGGSNLGWHETERNEVFGANYRNWILEVEGTEEPIFGRKPVLLSLFLKFRLSKISLFRNLRQPEQLPDPSINSERWSISQLVNRRLGEIMRKKSRGIIVGEPISPSWL